MMDGLAETIDATLSPAPAPDGAGPNDDGGASSDTLATLASAADRRSTEPLREPIRGTLIGRYVVLSRLGAGAMGIVLAAYDPKLDRKIALKLLRPRGGDRQAARARLLREAQALAKLNHRNVVAVHDVGVHEGQVFVAMEFVEGQTLGAWLKASPRSWREVLRVFTAAGRGLAAAHDVGLVHRDFKPDNVMLGDDGRVRVMDFGLARPQGDETISSAELQEFDSGEQAALDVSLTETGALMGTPAYMAPEQFGGGMVTARSDQFAYCVALYEALYDARPFDGDSPAQLYYSLSEGSPRRPPRGTSVPSWLRTVVLRGLSLAPNGRYTSMPQLLSAIEDGRTRRRHRRWLAAIMTVLLVGVSIAGSLHREEARRSQACARAADAIDEVWNDAARRDLRSSIIGTGVEYAPQVAEQVSRRLDLEADAWREHTTAACVRTEVEQTWDEAQFDKASWCLEDRKIGIAALIDTLSEAKPSDVHLAIGSASSLPLASTCMNEDSLAGMGEPPARELRSQVARVRALLSQATYLQSLGRMSEGLEVARRASAQAEALAWPPLTAAVLTREAMLLALDGSYVEAEAAGIRAYMEALQSGTWSVAATAASDLSLLVGRRLARHAEGELWSQHAAAAIAHAGDPLGLLNARRLRSLGEVHNAKGEYARAKEEDEQALATWEEVLGPEHPHVATTLDHIGTIERQLGRNEAAERLHERALSIWEKAGGPAHPHVTRARHNLATVYLAMHQHERAAEQFERVLQLDQNRLGADHPDLAPVLLNLGNLHYMKGDYDHARSHYERALALSEAAYGSEHPMVATAQDNLAMVHHALGAHRRAQVLAQRALAVREQALGPRHLDVATSSNNLGRVYESLGEYAFARSLYERSLSIREEHLEPKHPHLAYSLTGLGRVLARQGDRVQALAYLERALAIRSREGSDPALRDETQRALDGVRSGRGGSIREAEKLPGEDSREAETHADNPCPRTVLVDPPS